MSRDTVGNEDAWALDGRGLRHRLLRPADQVDLPGLAARWFRQTIRLVCPNAGPLALDPGLPGQIRGALGHVLLAAASEPARAGRPCCWSPPCAYDVVFGDHGRIASGEEMPKPLVLSVDALDQDLLVRATLFGFATDWIDAVAEALAVALGRVNTAVSRERAATILPDGAPARAAGRQSFLVSAQPQGRRPRVTATPLRLVPAERQIVVEEAVSSGTGLDTLVLRFLSPVVLRGKATLSNPRDVILSLARRMSGLARWQDAYSLIDWNCLADMADQCLIDTSSLVPCRWTRSSSAQNGKAVYMSGWTGDLVIFGITQPLQQLIELGATCNLGARTAFGQGRYIILD